MPLVQRVKTALSARFSRHFETKASRFGLAVSTGFVVAFVGLASTGLNHASFAYGLFDMFGSGMSEQQPRIYVDSDPMPERPWHHHRRRRSGEIASNVLSSDGESRPLPLGRRSVCVRLCDGYSFPVGTYHGESDRASHEATCESECPGAETALYVLPTGSDTMNDAVRVGTDDNYSELPDAFHYSTVIDSSCTCHPASGNRIKSLLHDFTLRRGDAIMTKTGFKVFHGGGQFPFRRKDFVALANSRDVRKSDRAAFKAIERASLPSVNTFAQQSQPASPAVSDNRGTKQLEHQASR